MDTIRTRLQTSKQFQGSALRCLRSTVTKEGVGGLYKGAFAPFVAQGLYKGVIFGERRTFGTSAPILITIRMRALARGQ